ncbi:histidine kinase [Pedobacter jejuensis]|uniref:histidine kinase n=1 Tax=Pedobacter jejuensis TaxID=1268550 RepID=UPI00142D9DFE|nr:histidine kinase [Pedobacter jejuensis]
MVYALTFIKNATRHNPEQADDAILRLSDIMSYAMERDIEGLAPLSKELFQMENIIQLNQLRYANRLHIRKQINIHVEAVLTLPIILLTMIENIFKHGNLLVEEHPAIIEIITNKDKISYYTRNLIGNQAPPQRNAEGCGLTNVKQRLESQFPEHVFEHNSDGLFFELKIEFPTPLAEQRYEFENYNS